MMRPIISEKSMGLASRGWYTFAVDRYTRKEGIAKDIEKAYHVDVVATRTVAMHGKVRRSGKKMASRRQADWKKAMVLLKPGQKIDAFEVTKQEPVPEEPKKAEEVKEMKAAEGKETDAKKEKKLKTQQKGKVKK